MPKLLCLGPAICRQGATHFLLRHAAAPNTLFTHTRPPVDSAAICMVPSRCYERVYTIIWAGLQITEMPFCRAQQVWYTLPLRHNCLAHSSVNQVHHGDFTYCKTAALAYACKLSCYRIPRVIPRFMAHLQLCMHCQRWLSCMTQRIV